VKFQRSLHLHPPHPDFAWRNGALGRMLAAGGAERGRAEGRGDDEGAAELDAASLLGADSDEGAASIGVGEEEEGLDAASPRGAGSEAAPSGRVSVGGSLIVASQAYGFLVLRAELTVYVADFSAHLVLEFGPGATFHGIRRKLPVPAGPDVVQVASSFKHLGDRPRPPPRSRDGSTWTTWPCSADLCHRLLPCAVPSRAERRRSHSPGAHEIAQAGHRCVAAIPQWPSRWLRRRFWDEERGRNS
jgi:hypothetical protein